MAKDPGLRRTYSERETAKILRRAAEIQSRTDRQRPAGDGLTPEELVRIGQEVGLDPDAIRQAMDGLKDDGDEVQTRWLGAPPSYEVERVFEGTLTDDQWNAIVGELNSTFTQSIEGVTSGPVRTWHYKADMGKVHFSATQTGNSFRLKSTTYMDDGIAVGMIMTILAMIVGSAITWSFDALRPYLSVLLMTVWVAGVGMWFRKITSNWHRRDRRKMNRMMDRIEARIAEASDNPVSRQVVPAEEPLEQRLGQV